MKTDLAQTLNATGRLALTAECRPPRGANAAVMRARAAALPVDLDAVVVADSAWACAAILAGEKRNPVLALATRDRNRLALEADAMGAAALGVESILCLSGDHQAIDPLAQPQAAGAYDIDSVQLLLGLKTLGEQGTDFGGRKVDAPPSLFLGAAAYPYQRPLALNLLRLRKKVRAGAKFLITQAVFDLAGFTAWMAAVRAAGIDRQAAILAGILPLGSVAEAQALAASRGDAGPSPELISRLQKAPDAAREGIAIATEWASKLKDIPGVRGIHIYSGGCESSAAAVIQGAGLSPQA
jgi:methylenetetrahydrofolate reductase (NADPH)